MLLKFVITRFVVQICPSHSAWLHCKLSTCLPVCFSLLQNIKWGCGHEQSVFNIVNAWIKVFCKSLHKGYSMLKQLFSWRLLFVVRLRELQSELLCRLLNINFLCLMYLDVAVSYVANPSQAALVLWNSLSIDDRPVPYICFRCLLKLVYFSKFTQKQTSVACICSKRSVFVVAAQLGEEDRPWLPQKSNFDSDDEDLFIIIIIMYSGTSG